MKFLIALVSLLTIVSTAPTDVPNENITFGTFTHLSEDGAQFKSYDDEVWWYLQYEDIGYIPELNQPYSIIYDTNGTEYCGCDYCDNCWREDDVLKKIEKIK